MLSEDLTQKFPATSFEGRVLNELAAMRKDFNNRLDALEGRLTSVEKSIASFDGRLTSMEKGLASLDSRLTSLEEKVDARLRETRPIWESVQQRLTEIEAALKSSIII